MTLVVGLYRRWGTWRAGDATLDPPGNAASKQVRCALYGRELHLCTTNTYTVHALDDCCILTQRIASYACRPCTRRGRNHHPAHQVPSALYYVALPAAMSLLTHSERLYWREVCLDTITFIDPFPGLPQLKESERGRKRRVIPSHHRT